MTDNPQNQYLKAQILTAGPEQLQMMLYDGAIRFCEQARQAIRDGDVPNTHDRLVRAQRIVLELSSGLKTDVNPELCGKLASLYNYVYRLLIDANFHRAIEPLEEAMDLLRYQRDTWQMLLSKLRLQRSATTDAAQATLPTPPDPSATTGAFAGSTLCLDG